MGGRTALIIPARNEEDVLGVTLSRIPPDLFDWVVVADNGSTDQTSRIAREHGAIVVYESEPGYGAACLRAIGALPAECGVVVFLQADASEDAREAACLMAPILDGRADLVIGSRTLGKAEPGALLPHQRLGNWLACFLIRRLYGFSYTDLGPFRAIRADSLRRLRMRDRNYGWTVEMQVRALEEGLRILEMPVRYGKRVAGVNQVSGDWRASLRAGWVILATIARLWFTRRRRMS